MPVTCLERWEGRVSGLDKLPGHLCQEDTSEAEDGEEAVAGKSLFPKEKEQLQKKFPGPAKLFTCTSSFNPPNNLLRWGLLALIKR